MLALATDRSAKQFDRAASFWNQAAGPIETTFLGDCRPDLQPRDCPGRFEHRAIQRRKGQVSYFANQLTARVQV